MKYLDVVLERDEGNGGSSVMNENDASREALHTKHGQDLLHKEELTNTDLNYLHVNDYRSTQRGNLLISAALYTKNSKYDHYISRGTVNFPFIFLR